MSRDNILCHDRVLPRLRDFVLRSENCVVTWLARHGRCLWRHNILCRDRIG